MGDRGQWVEAHRWGTKDGDTKARRDMVEMKIGDEDTKVARCARSRANDTKIRRRCEDTKLRRYGDAEIRRYEDAETRRCGDKMIINVMRYDG